jgi:hypothetical protein
VLAVIAAAYAAVGQAGATGHIAAMGLAGYTPDVIRPAALALNTLVAAIKRIDHANRITTVIEITPQPLGRCRNLTNRFATAVARREGLEPPNEEIVLLTRCGGRLTLVAWTPSGLAQDGRRVTVH